MPVKRLIRQWYWNRAVESARCQHPVTGRGARFVVSGTTCLGVFVHRIIYCIQTIIRMHADQTISGFASLVADGTAELHYDHSPSVVKSFNSSVILHEVNVKAKTRYLAIANRSRVISAHTVIFWASCSRGESIMGHRWWRPLPEGINSSVG